MAFLRLSVLGLLTAGILMDVVGSDMCDDGWVYHLETATCLQAVPINRSILNFYGFENPCQSRKGGDSRIISGIIMTLTEKMEPYLKDYLQFLSVPAALVEVTFVLLSWPRHEFPDLKRFRLEGLTQYTYFNPGRLILFTSSPPREKWVICQVPAGNLEPPNCPRDVQLVSVSDRSATLSWSPGQLGRKVDVNVKVQTCDAGTFACVDFTSKTFPDVSLFQARNYTVTGLQPETRHNLVIQILLDDNNRTEDCNMTLALTTEQIFAAAPVTMPRKEEGQEVSGTVVGLATALAISIVMCLVLSCLLLRNSRQSKDGNSDAEKTDARGMESKFIVNPPVNLQDHNNQETSGTMYLNIQQSPETYDKPIEQDDNHIYEM